MFYLKKFQNLFTLNLFGNPAAKNEDYSYIIRAHFPKLTFLDYRIIDEASVSTDSSISKSILCRHCIGISSPCDALSFLITHNWCAERWSIGEISECPGGNRNWGTRGSYGCCEWWQKQTQTAHGISAIRITLGWILINFTGSVHAMSCQISKWFLDRMHLWSTWTGRVWLRACWKMIQRPSWYRVCPEWPLFSKHILCLHFIFVFKPNRWQFDHLFLNLCLHLRKKSPNSASRYLKSVLPNTIRDRQRWTPSLVARHRPSRTHSRERGRFWKILSCNTKR